MEHGAGVFPLWEENEASPHLSRFCGLPSGQGEFLKIGSGSAMDRRRRAECSHLRFYLVLYHLWFLLHHMMTLLAIQFRFHFFLPRQWLISFSGSYFHSAVKTDSLLWQLSWRVIMSYWGWKKGGKARTDEEKKCSTRTRSINRTPPRGSLTGIVGLFTRKKTLHRSPNPSFHRAHLSSVPALRPTFPGNCFIAVFAVIFPSEKWDWGDWGQGFGHGRGVRKLGTKIFNPARRSKTIVAPCGPCRT